MPNDALLRAIAEAHVTSRDLARACEVDEKTVQRWISREDRLPHPRHRYAVAERLGVDETVVWPESMRRYVKTGADREIVSVYPRRADMPKSVWRKLITDAWKTITFGGYTSYFLWIELPDLRSVLRRKLDQGCRVRFLLGDPDSEATARREVAEAVPLTIRTRISITLDELVKLGTVEGLETRFSDQHLAMSAFEFDEQLLVMTHLGNLVGHDSPVLHLERYQDGGLFDRYLWHLNELWQGARPA
jgi:lambda repressor-like predicted transcriptional regulator